MTAAIETLHLTKVYDETTAVDSLSLSVPEGIISCLLGPNGSGKTTTIAMLTTLRRPTSGMASVFGSDVVADPQLVRGMIGVTMQHTGVDDLMTGRELLSLQANLHGIRGRAAEGRIADLVDLLALGSHMDTRLGTWSGGLRRRVDLAGALIHRPRLMFFDEPTTGLDPASRRAIWDEVRRINRENGVTVLLTTQYLEEADSLADEVAILNTGTLIAQASPTELKAGLCERTLEVTFGDEDSARAAQAEAGGSIEPSRPRVLRIIIDRAGIPQALTCVTRDDRDVEHIRITEPTLEDVFLNLTAT